jgi:hypothetical protein
VSNANPPQPAQREITVAGVGHAYGVDPGDLWFAGRLAVAPERLVGRRVVVCLNQDEAGRLAAELLTILSARRARREQSGTTT